MSLTTPPALHTAENIEDPTDGPALVFGGPSMAGWAPHDGQSSALTPGALVRSCVQWLLDGGEKTPKPAFLYAEKPRGFQCRTCAYAVPANGTHGYCAVVEGTIHLDQGCCVAWAADLEQLQVHRDFT